MTNPQPEHDAHEDDALMAMVHAGHKIVVHLTIILNRETMQYEIRRGKEEEIIERADTQSLALRLADVYLGGYLDGYDQSRTDEVATPTEGEVAPHVHRFRGTKKLPFMMDDRRN